MNFPSEYRSIGNIDITAIKQLVSNLSQKHWSDNKIAQNQYGERPDIETIALVWDDDFRHSKPTKRPALGMFSNAIRATLAKIADFYESDERWHQYFGDNGRGYFVRASLLKIKSGGKIAARQDKFFSLTHSHHIHIPLVTNDEVYFDIGQMTMNLLEGEIVEINNRKVYSVTNNSEFDNVNLVLDWVVPGEKCCCGERLRADIPCSPEACMRNDQLIDPCHCFQ